MPEIGQVAAPSLVFASARSGAMTIWETFTEFLQLISHRIIVDPQSLLDPDYNDMKRLVFPIASRTIDPLVRTQGIGDLYQVFALCRRDGNDFHLVDITVHMKKLLDRGYQMAVKGYPWETAPPGFILEP